MDKEKALEKMNAFSANTMVEHIGIEFTDMSPEHVCGKMPVDYRTVQPYGLLHGGASATLAETLGSVAGGMHIDRQHRQQLQQKVSSLVGHTVDFHSTLTVCV